MIIDSGIVTGSLTVQGQVYVTGSIQTTGGITGSFSGTATSALYVYSSSLDGGQNTRLNTLESVTGSYALTSSFNSFTSSYNTASSSLSTRVTNTESTSSALTTASSSFSTRVTATEATASSLTTASSSFSTRVTATEATASAYVTTSGSFSTRVTNTESTASALTTASSSFSTRTTVTEATASSLTTASSSFSTRVTATEATASSLTTASGSFSSRVATIESKYITTGSNSFNGSQTITGSLTATGTITAQTLVVQTVTSSIVYSSGSNIFGQNTGNTQSMTGSVGISGSLTINGVTTSNSTITGTTVYGSTAACAPVGLFTSCLGIGALQTNVALNISHPGTSDAIRMINTGIGGGTWYIGDGTGTGGSPGMFAIVNSNVVTTPRLVINASGSIGIGTSSPGAKLDVYQSAACTGLQVYVNDVGTARVADLKGYDNTLGVVSRMVVLANGNVAIGTTTNLGGGNLEVLSNATSAFTARSSTTTGANGGTTVVSVRSVDCSASYWANAQYNAWQHLFNVSGTTEAMRIVSGGDVGIGTSSPQYKLDVNGSGRFTSSVYSNGILYVGDGASVSKSMIYMYGVFAQSYAWNICNKTTGMEFSSGTGCVPLFLANGSNVGIGTTSPFSLLHVGTRPGAGTTNPSLGSIATVSNDGLTGIDLGGNVNANNVVGHINWVNYYGVGNYNTARIDVYADGAGNSGALRFWTASASSSPTEHMRITSGGDIQTKGGTVYFGASNTGDIFVSPSTGYMYFEYPTSYGAIFRTQSGSESMRITSGGNVGIGTTSPSLESGGTGLNIVNSTYTQLRIESTASSAGIEFKPGSGTRYEIQANTSCQWFVYDRTNSAYRFLIGSSGNVGIGTTSPSSLLDVSGVLTVKSGYFGGGYLKLNYTASDVASRSWVVANDYYYSGDFGIYQSTTQSGSTYCIKLYVSCAGSVGINTTSPLSYQNYTYLQIDGKSTTNGGVVRLRTCDGGYTNELAVDSSGGYINSSSNFLLYTASNIRLNISSTGIACFACQVCAPKIVTGEASFTAAYTCSFPVACVAGTYATVIPPNTITTLAVYLAHIHYDNGVSSPYTVEAAFIFKTANTNGGGTDNAYFPMSATHQGGTGCWSFRNIAGTGQVSSGLQVQAHSFANTPGNATLYLTRLA